MKLSFQPTTRYMFVGIYKSVDRKGFTLSLMRFTTLENVVIVRDITFSLSRKPICIDGGWTTLEDLNQTRGFTNS